MLFQTAHTKDHEIVLKFAKLRKKNGALSYLLGVVLTGQEAAQRGGHQH